MTTESVKTLNHLIALNQDLNKFVEIASRRMNVTDMGTIHALNSLLNNTSARDAQLRAQRARLKRSEE